MLGSLNVVAGSAVRPTRSTAPRRARGVAVRAGKEEEIYIGKGKKITDDPSKYPEKNEFVGGWAGGEVGLWSFRDEAKAGATAAPAEEEPAEPAEPSEGVAEAKWVDGRSVKARVVKQGGDTLYIGNGRFITDASYKYGGKEDVGAFPGATGGFAGGERGLQQFLETGDIEFTDGRPTQGQSPLAGGFLIAGMGAGLYALSDSVDVVGKEATGATAQIPGVEIGIAVFGVGFLVVLVSVLAKRAASAAAEGIEKGVKVAALITTVAIVAKYIIDN
ncbi:unnamed protein product [Pedinophyceae sp. YPF-701]|nr:unnamed protein product [Pedinophyceae sp. YPF-701]